MTGVLNYQSLTKEHYVSALDSGEVTQKHDIELLIAMTNLPPGTGPQMAEWLGFDDQRKFERWIGGNGISGRFRDYLNVEKPKTGTHVDWWRIVAEAKRESVKSPNGKTRPLWVWYGLRRDLIDALTDLGYLNTNEASLYPDQVDSDISYFEGQTKQILVNAYERNAKARAKCIDHYTAVCCVCEFDFLKKYGGLGTGFIHVHHLIELSSIGDAYEVDPIKDLRPVCPNCHAMLHRRKPAYSIQELKDIIETAI